MKIKDLVQKVIGEAVKPIGFELESCDRETWVYVKEEGDIKKNIMIHLLQKGKMKLYFSTNAYGHKSVDGASLEKGGEKKGDSLGIYHFSNEQEFIETLECFRKIIFDYGLSELERMSAPTTEVRPTRETNLFLYENHAELNKQYREKLNIDDNMTHQEIFKIIQDYLVDTQGVEFEDVKRDLIGLAAVAGYVYLDACNGAWQWDNDKCWITNREKYPKDAYPLGIIIDHWRDGATYAREMLDNYYNYLLKK